MGRCALCVSLALAIAVTGVQARAETTPAPGDTPAAEAAELFDTLRTGTMAERERAAAELAELGAPALPAIEEFLAREREATEDERRAVLSRIGASVPDEDGRFRSPGRQSAQEIRDDDDFDWLKNLYELDELPGLGGVIADAASVRALAASGVPDGARAILDFAFTEDGRVIRDECGRYLRAMAPTSIPALIRGAGTRGEPPPKRRYARYQLGRIDREDPPKALAAAAGEDLQVEILRAYADTLWREAVFAILGMIDHESPPVRSAAREAWLAYVTGDPPPPATKQRLREPGGGRTDEPKPLYRNARELADHALRRHYREVFGDPPARGTSLGDISHELFDHYDEQRQQSLEVTFEEALERAESGDIDGAIAAFDRILVQDPDFPRRADMVGAYMARGEQRHDAGRFSEAAAAFAKAHMLDPDGARAEEARAAQRRARAEALAAEGDEEARDRAAAPPPEPEPQIERPWLLFSGIGVGLVAVFLGVIGLAARRRQSHGS